MDDAQRRWDGYWSRADRIERGNLWLQPWPGLQAVAVVDPRNLRAKLERMPAEQPVGADGRLR